MIAVPTIEAATPANTCPGCGAPFAPGGRGMGKKFCTDPCRRAFHRAAVGEGAVFGPLVKAWQATRHAKPGTREAEICRYARSELTRIARAMRAPDAAAGRDPVAYVGTLMDSQTRHEDRTRK